jgi:integrase
MSTLAPDAFRAAPFPSQGLIYDRAGMPVDASGWVWKLNSLSRSRTLNFRRFGVGVGSLLTSIVLFIAERIALTSPDDVRNSFEALLLLRKSTIFMDALRDGGDLDRLFFDQMRTLNEIELSRLHHVRSWYGWCARQELPHFSPEVANELDDLVIPGNEKGRAVRTRDPLYGAFDELEFVAIYTKLRAIGPAVLSTIERALLWLAIAFGANPFAYALMREEDFKPLAEIGTGRVYHLIDVPLIKKRGVYARGDFDRRKLNQEIGSAVVDLLAENARCRTARGWPDGCAFPLFARRSPQNDLFEGPLHDFAMHMTNSEVTSIIKAAVEKLDIVSHRTGEPLRVDARRFRRTYATRAVEEGMSPAELAVGLGHADLQNVVVYFETRPSQVDRLDAALPTKLGPIADAFMGRIVETDDNIVNGEDPAKRIPWFRRKFAETPERKGDLGTCGSGPCSLFAPVSCYTCKSFQPWRNGPHREVLDWLCEERDRKQKAGLDPQIVGLHDATILAVGKVVVACEGGAA